MIKRIFLVLWILLIIVYLGWCWIAEESGSSTTTGRIFTSTATFNSGAIFNSVLTLPTTGITGAGSSSGLNADKLDGNDSSYYATTTSTNNSVNINVFRSSMNAIETQALYLDGGTMTGGVNFNSNNATNMGAATSATLDTGQGANELYDMNQNVQTTNDVTFNSVTASSANAGELTATNINTGQGLTEVYLMNQNLRNTDSVTFNSVNTGQGNYELYQMNQDVQTTNDVTFGTVDTGQGANELYDMNQNVQTTDNVTFATATVTRLISGVQGKEGQVWTKFGSSDSWAAAAATASGADNMGSHIATTTLSMGAYTIITSSSMTWADGSVSTSANSGNHAGGGGGGSAYTAREYKWEAGEFSYPSWGNALLYKNEFGNATSSKTLYTADFDTNTDEFVSFSISNFDSKYDGGNITWEITFFSSAAVTGMVEFNIDVTTATALNSTLVNTQTFGNFDAGDGTAYEITIATSIQSANLPVANKAYHCVSWVDASDSSIGSDTKVWGIKMKYGVSAD